MKSRIGFVRKRYLSAAKSMTHLYCGFFGSTSRLNHRVYIYMQYMEYMNNVFNKFALLVNPITWWLCAFLVTFLSARFLLQLHSYGSKMYNLASRTCIPTLKWILCGIRILACCKKLWSLTHQSSTSRAPVEIKKGSHVFSSLNDGMDTEKRDCEGKDKYRNMRNTCSRKNYDRLTMGSGDFKSKKCLFPKIRNHCKPPWNYSFKCTHAPF